MIGKTSRGANFDALARYLANPKVRGEPDRVAWTEARNVMTSDIMTASQIMASTSRLSKRVEKPCYHLTLSWAPEDKPKAREMRHAADFLLDRLGLNDHQVIMVAHNDTGDDRKGEGKGHEHVHLMINRVHPETGKAWAGRHDYRQIEQALREHETLNQLRLVPGRHSGLEREKERDYCPTHADRHLAARSPSHDTVSEALTRMSKENCRKLKENLRMTLTDASSWADLEARLGRRNLKLEAKGQGITIVRGGAYAKLSDLMPPKRKVKDMIARFGSIAEHLKRRHRDRVKEPTNKARKRKYIEARVAELWGRDRDDDRARER